MIEKTPERTRLVKPPRQPPIDYITGAYQPIEGEKDAAAAHGSLLPDVDAPNKGQGEQRADESDKVRKG
jgi:hypothetical protein